MRRFVRFGTVLGASVWLFAGVCAAQPADQESLPLNPPTLADAQRSFYNARYEEAAALTLALRVDAHAVHTGSQDRKAHGHAMVSIRFDVRPMGFSAPNAYAIRQLVRFDTDTAEFRHQRRQAVALLNP